MICTLYAPWFGGLPFYAGAFLSCCARSKNIQFCIASDQVAPDNLPANIFWQQVDASTEILKLFSFAPIRQWRHKLCDLKPFWHLIFHDSRCAKAEYMGWVDWDVYHNLSALEFNFEAAKFTKGEMCSPLFIARKDSWLNVWPAKLKSLLQQTAASGWDESYYLKNIDATVLQKGMTPELDLFERAEYAVHMYRAKHIPALYRQWVDDYFQKTVPRKPASAGFLLSKK